MDLKTIFRKQMPNEVIVTSLLQLDLSRYVSSTLSKWQEKVNIHWAKTKFKTEWEGSYPVKWILSDPFFVFKCSLHLVLVLFDAVDKSPGFLTLISRFLIFWD